MTTCILGNAYPADLTAALGSSAPGYQILENTVKYCNLVRRFDTVVDCYVVNRYVNQHFDRLPQQLVDSVMTRCFTSIFTSHYKTTALRAGELTVTTLAGVSQSWWKAVNRWTASSPGRRLRRTTRHQIDSN